MGWVRPLAERLRALLNRGREEAELDEELRFHLEKETEKLLARGWEPREARREAYRRFGGVERMKERVRDERGVTWVEEALRDVRFARRSFGRTPGLTALMVGTLTLGIGAATATFSVVDAVLLRPLPFRGAERMVQIWEEDAGGRRYFPGYANFADWRERTRSFERLVGTMDPGPTTVLGDFEPFQAENLAFTRGFFEAVGVSPALGRLPTPDENRPGAPPVALVSESLWRDRLGAPPSLRGVTLEMRGEVMPVVGVIPGHFRMFGRHDVFVPGERAPMLDRGSHSHRVFGWLAPGVALEEAEAELDAVMDALKAEHGDALHAESVVLRSLDDVMVGPHRSALWLLLGASGLVLLVACLNVAGALLARGRARERELAVRLSLGAGRRRLFGQLVTEAGVLALLGGVGGVALAAVAVGVVARLGAGVIPRLETAAVDPAVLAVAVVSAGAAVLLAGVLPARGSLEGLSPTLRSVTRASPGGERAWTGLVACESAFTLALLLGAGLLVRSLVAMVGADVGFESRGVVTARIDVPEGSFADAPGLVAFWNGVLDRVRATPGVESAGLVNILPMDAFNRAGGVSRADAGEWAGLAEWRVAEPGYLDALGIELLEGRMFDADPPGGAAPVLVNRVLAERLAPDGSAVGLLVVSSSDPREEPLEVVGVVEEARLWQVDPGVQATVFVPWRARPEQTAAMVLAARVRGPEGPVAAAVRRAVREGSARAAVEVGRLDDQVAATQADRRFVIGVLLTFAGVALGLALVGIYGIVAYTVERGRRDLGIRLALGATSGRVRRRVVARTLGVVAAGALGGLLLAAAGAGLVESLLYGVEAGDPWSAGVALALLLATAAVAAWVPAWRYGRVDPVTVLAAE